MKLALSILPIAKPMLRIAPFAVSVFALTLTNPAFAQEEMLRTLTVTGQGTEYVATTRTQVQLGVEVEGNTAAEAQQEAAQRSDAVVNLLRSRNVSKLQTQGINLYPRYDYSGERQRLIGYTASNVVSFEVPTEQAGGLIDEAVRAGATRIDSVSFVAEDEAIDTAQRQALREATADAQSQADAVLDALGLERQEVVSIQVNGAMTPPPMPVPFAADVAQSRAESAPTPVVGGEQEVQASVTLQISY